MREKSGRSLGEVREFSWNFHFQLVQLFIMFCIIKNPTPPLLMLLMATYTTPFLKGNEKVEAKPILLATSKPVVVPWEGRGGC